MDEGEREDRVKMFPFHGLQGQWLAFPGRRTRD